ncbi:uncharacterized protein JCM15063_000021 [Sporobolomyces koalae]|uniref:uncharacterized protein n=1 Tax=Sporobolomyces koalae TaxID=500713 RepID=UPI00317160F5
MELVVSAEPSGHRPSKTSSISNHSSSSQVRLAHAIDIEADSIDHSLALGSSTIAIRDSPSPYPRSLSIASLSRNSSLRSSSTTSSRRPLPLPPTDSTRFVPSRPVPPPPASFSSSTYSEKRELARLRGLDDLVEHAEIESPGISSPGSSAGELPAYEDMGSIVNADKTVLREDERIDDDEAVTRSVDAARRRTNEETRRMIEQDRVDAKGWYRDQQAREVSNSRDRQERQLEIETAKRIENARPVSPVSRVRVREGSRPHEGSRSAFALPSTLPLPPPVTTFETLHSSSSTPRAHATPRYRDELQQHSSLSSRVSNSNLALPCSPRSISGRSPSLYPSSSFSPPASHFDGGFPASDLKQHALGPAAAFYSTGVRDTMQQLSLQETVNTPQNTRPVQEDTAFASVSVPTKSIAHRFVEPRPRTNSTRSTSYENPTGFPVRQQPPQSPSPSISSRIASPAQGEHYSVQLARTSSFATAVPLAPTRALPVCYHSIGSRLIPVYEASSLAEAITSPAVPQTLDLHSTLPIPPPPHLGHRSLSPPIISNLPIQYEPLNPTTNSTARSDRDSPDRFELNTLEQRSNRARSIRTLFGRKSTGLG